MKKKKGLSIQINFSNRWLYTFIAIGILIIMGVGVYAWANPITGVGHDLSEIDFSGQIQELSATKINVAEICLNGDCITQWPSVSASLYLDEHTEEECKTLYGIVMGAGDNKFCKLSGSSCSSFGWTQYGNWRSTSPKTCGSDIDCRCTTTSHSFSEAGIETCSYGTWSYDGYFERWACINPQNTCTATVTEVGCY